jgi:hypothetical protein
MWFPTQATKSVAWMGHPASFRFLLETKADPSLTTPKLMKTFGAPCTQDDSVFILRSGNSSFVCASDDSLFAVFRDGSSFIVPRMIAHSLCFGIAAHSLCLG